MKLFKKKKLINEITPKEHELPFVSKMKVSKIYNMPTEFPTAYLLEGKRTFEVDGTTYTTGEIFLYRLKVEDNEVFYDFLLLTGEDAGKLFKDVNKRHFLKVVDTNRANIVLDDEYAIKDIFICSNNHLENNGYTYIIPELKKITVISHFQLSDCYNSVNKPIFLTMRNLQRSKTLFGEVWQDIDNQK